MRAGGLPPLIERSAKALGLFFVALSLCAAEAGLLGALPPPAGRHCSLAVVSFSLAFAALGGLAVVLFPRRPSSRVPGGVPSPPVLLLPLSILADWALLRLAPVEGGAAAAALLPFLFTPFLFGGMTASLAMARNSLDACRDSLPLLAGAAAGSAAALLVPGALDPLQAVAAAAALAAPAVLLLPARGGAARVIRSLAVLAFASAAMMSPSLPGRAAGPSSGPGLLWSRDDGRTDVAVHAPAPSGDEGLPAAGVPGLPPRLALTVDGRPYGAVFRHRRGATPRWPLSTLLALPFQAREGGETLVIGAGGGRDVVVAAALGGGPVTAVEANPLVVAAAEGVSFFSGSPYSLPGVVAVVEDPRGFLARDTAKYDVITVNPPDGRPSPSAVFTFAAGGLHSLEAFHHYLDHLKPGGVVAVSLSPGAGDLARLVATGRRALEQRGATGPARRIFAASGAGMSTVLFRSSPFSKGEAEALGEWCRQRGFTVLHSPGRASAGPLAEVTDTPRQGGEPGGALTAAAPPVTDDGPSYSSPGGLRDGLGMLAGPEGLGPCRGAAAFALALALALLVPPRRSAGRGGVPGKGGLQATLFFAGLGLGAAFEALTLAQRLGILLGASGLLAAVAPAALFASAALGSRLARDRSGERVHLRRRCALLVLALLVENLALPAVIDSSLSLPAAGRLLVASAALFPAGFLLGQVFPLGMGLLAGRGERLAPWAWSVAAAFAAAGTMSALLTAVVFGYGAAALAGPAALLVAAAVSESLDGEGGAGRTGRGGRDGETSPW